MRVSAQVIMAGLIAVILAGTTGCSAMGVEEEFKTELEASGIPVEAVAVPANACEAEIMADRMILDSHGISNPQDFDMKHANVTLKNGKVVSAVKYKDKIYTYKNPQ